jgi:hypothetical protein
LHNQCCVRLKEVKELWEKLVAKGRVTSAGPEKGGSSQRNEGRQKTYGWVVGK